MRCVHIIIIFMERNWKISHIIFKQTQHRLRSTLYKFNKSAAVALSQRTMFTVALNL